MKGFTARMLLALITIWLALSSQSANAQFLYQQCRPSQVCTTSPSGVQTCVNETHCWWLRSFDGGFIFTYPEGSSSGVSISQRLQDVQPNATMDCWKGVTDNARESSGFPYRNDGVTPHNGVDIVSDSGNYGRGAPIRSFGTGVVSETGYDDMNGNFVRVNQGDGIQLTYIHLLDLTTASGTRLQRGQNVHVGEQIGRMNCTGNCGGTIGQPTRGRIESTHVHAQARRISDRQLLDPVDLYGGQNCSLGSTPSSGTSSGGNGPGGGTGTCNSSICTDEP